VDRSGAAATLSLEEDGRMAAAVHLTGPPLAADPSAADYLELVDPAAVWLQYEVARALKDRPKHRPQATAHAAESFALLRKGLDLHLAHDDQEARKAYEKAVALDPRNWAARVNLAMLEARVLNRYAVAVAMLRDALDDIKYTRAP
jgi:tetratricopeptide (TPR) repeat protein